MKIRAVIQINKAGERNVVLTKDEDASVDDFLITAGDWKESQVVDTHVGLVAEESVINLITEAELRGHGVANPHIDHDAIAAMENMLGSESGSVH